MKKGDDDDDDDDDGVWNVENEKSYCTVLVGQDLLWARDYRESFMRDGSFLNFTTQLPAHQSIINHLITTFHHGEWDRLSIASTKVEHNIDECDHRFLKHHLQQTTTTTTGNLSTDPGD
jgi:hypothetical protein